MQKYLPQRFLMNILREHVCVHQSSTNCKFEKSQIFCPFSSTEICQKLSPTLLSHLKSCAATNIFATWSEAVLFHLIAPGGIISMCCRLPHTDPHFNFYCLHCCHHHYPLLCCYMDCIDTLFMDTD